MSVKQTTFKRFLTGSFFLIAFAFFYSGVTFIPTTHTHADSAIVHSHPFKKDNKGNAGHTHTTTEFILLAGATHFVSTGHTPCATIITAEQTVISSLFVKTNSPIQANAIRSSFFLRPPPASFSL